MIVILTDYDLDLASDFAEVSLDDFDDDLWSAINAAEDVYFWRDGEVKPLKRRNAPLVVPDWLQCLEGVDR